jgi:hypothetical protein
MAASSRLPTIDPTLCTNYRACVEHCPKHAIEEPLNFCCAKCVKYCLSMEVPCRPAGVTICADLSATARVLWLREGHRPEDRDPLRRLSPGLPKFKEIRIGG